MKVFITGANGFFGSRLAAELAGDKKSELVLLLRPGRDSNVPAGKNIRTVEGDLTDPDSYRRHLAGCDAVYHAAAKVSTWARNSGDFDRVNVDGTLDVLRSAADAGAKKIIYVSTFLALPDSPDAAPLDEGARPDRSRHWNDYERTKYEANLRAVELMEGGAPLCILYPTVMYGPGPMTAGNLVTGMVRDHLRGKLPARLGDGQQVWNFAYVDGVVRGATVAMHRAAPGERFILGGENATLDAFFDALHEVGGKPPPRMALPWFAAKLVAAVEEGLAAATGRQPKTTRGAIEIFRRNWAFDSSHAGDRLGYDPRGLHDGLKRTVDWLRSEGLA